MKTDAVLKLSPENAWAMGCEYCTFGIVEPPPVTGLSMPLYVIRAFHFHFGYLLTCDCKAGTLYQRYIENVWTSIESKKLIISLEWSTAIHKQMAALDEARSVRAVHGMEID